MLKKSITLALAALAALAVSVPVASANWFKHTKVIEANETVQLTGQVKISSIAVGTIECKTQAKVKLLTNQTTANLEEFALDAAEGKTPTDLCTTGGVLNPCKVTSVGSSASTQSPWVAHLLQNRDTIDITTGVIQTTLEGADSKPGNHTACGVMQTVQLQPADWPGKETFVHATVVEGETCTASKATLSGKLETQTGAKVQITGTQNINPAATYGTLC